MSGLEPLTLAVSYWTCKRLRRAALWLERVLSHGQQCELPVAGWLFLPPGGRVLDAWSRSVDELGDANEAAVADDLSGRVIGVSGPSAMLASEARLGFAVLPMPVSAARAGLTGAGRWDGDYVDTSLEGPHWLTRICWFSLRPTAASERLRPAFHDGDGPCRLRSASCWLRLLSCRQCTWPQAGRSPDA